MKNYQLGALLKEIRTSKGFTQKDLSDLLHVSPDSISLWELNKREPSLEVIRKYTKIFNVTSDYILGLED